MSKNNIFLDLRFSDYMIFFLGSLGAYVFMSRLFGNKYGWIGIIVVLILIILKKRME